jgi:hypothetical protein
VSLESTHHRVSFIVTMTVKIASWVGLTTLLASTFFLMKAAYMITESIGIFSIDKNLIGGFFLGCTFCLLSLRAAHSIISLGASSLFVFASIYYCISLAAASSQCLAVCTIVDLTCSSAVSAITSEVAIRVGSKSSETSENLALGLESDDHFALGASDAIQGAFEVRKSIFIYFFLSSPTSRTTV